MEVYTSVFAEPKKVMLKIVMRKIDSRCVAIIKTKN